MLSFDKKIISYSLFEPILMPHHRTWDKSMNNPKRYWFNLPSLFLTNRILFPEHILRLYVSQNVWSNELSSILKILKNNEILDIHTINLDYKLTEPAVWRMMPLWSMDVAVMHSRDVDSFPTIDELKYIDFFEKSNFLVGTIRSQKNHWGYACRMLAGLSSFKTSIPQIVKGPSFNSYYSKKHGKYGCDQDLIADTFTSNRDFVANHFLDCKVNEQKNENSFPCAVFEPTKYEFDLATQQAEVLEQIDKHLNPQWLGQPCDARGPYTKFIFSKFEKIMKEIQGINILREFYLEDTNG